MGGFVRVNFTKAYLVDLFNPVLTTGSGGFQSLFRFLQKKADKKNMYIDLNEKDIQRIKNYFTDYGSGGWQDALFYIFGENILSSLSHGFVPSKPRLLHN